MRQHLFRFAKDFIEQLHCITALSTAVSIVQGNERVRIKSLNTFPPTDLRELACGNGDKREFDCFAKGRIRVLNRDKERSFGIVRMSCQHVDRTRQRYYRHTAKNA